MIEPRVVQYKGNRAFNLKTKIKANDTLENQPTHSRPQRPRSFWSAPRIATSGQVQHRKSAIHGLPVTLRMFRVKFDKSDWFWYQSIVFTKPFRNGMSLDRCWTWPEVAILGADQKERGLWGRECNPQ